MCICHPMYLSPLIHPSVRVRACAVVRTVGLSRPVWPVMRRQTVWERVCVRASPRSAPSKQPRKTSPSAARARVSAWTGWGIRHRLYHGVTQHVQLHCPTARQCVRQCCTAGPERRKKVNSWPWEQQMTKQTHSKVHLVAVLEFSIIPHGLQEGVCSVVCNLAVLFLRP